MARSYHRSHTAGNKIHKPDRAGPKPPRENTNLKGMPRANDMDRPMNKAPRIGRHGTRPARGW